MMKNYAATMLDATGNFHFQPCVAAFGKKPHSSFFSKKCGGLPKAATTASGPSALSEGRVPRAPHILGQSGRRSAPTL